MLRLEEPDNNVIKGIYAGLPFLLLVSFFVAALVIASVLAYKLVQVWIIIVPGGVIAYSLTFTATDTISEIYGRKAANLVVLAGFLALASVFILVSISIKLPAADFWKGGEHYNQVFGASLRIIVASLIAYLLSQFHDVWAFHFWRKMTKGKHLWLRNNLSTCASQLIDTVVFIFIAFAGTGAPVFTMMWGQFLAKAVIAAADTPFVYLLVGILRRRRIAAFSAHCEE